MLHRGLARATRSRAWLQAPSWTPGAACVSTRAAAACVEPQEAGPSSRGWGLGSVDDPLPRGFRSQRVRQKQRKQRRQQLEAAEARSRNVEPNPVLPPTTVAKEAAETDTEYAAEAAAESAQYEAAQAASVFDQHFGIGSGGGSTPPTASTNHHEVSPPQQPQQPPTQQPQLPSIFDEHFGGTQTTATKATATATTAAAAAREPAASEYQIDAPRIDSADNPYRHHTRTELARRARRDKAIAEAAKELREATAEGPSALSIASDLAIFKTERWRTLQGELLEPTTVSRREVAADRNLSMEIAKLDLPQDVRDLFKAQSADFGLQSSVAAMNAIASRLAQPVDAMSKRRAAKIASDPVTAEDLDMMAEAAQDALQAELRRHDRLLAEQLESEEAVEAAASRVVKEVAHVTLPPNAPVPRDAAVLPKELDPITPRLLSNLVWSLGKLGFADRAVYTLASVEALKRIDRFNNKDIVQLVHGLSRNTNRQDRVNQHLLLNVLAPTVARRSRHFATNELGALLNAYAGVTHPTAFRPPRVFGSKPSAVARHTSEGDALSNAVSMRRNVAQAFSRIGSELLLRAQYGVGGHDHRKGLAAAKRVGRVLEKHAKRRAQQKQPGMTPAMAADPSLAQDVARASREDAPNPRVLANAVSAFMLAKTPLLEAGMPLLPSNTTEGKADCVPHTSVPQAATIGDVLLGLSEPVQAAVGNGRGRADMNLADVAQTTSAYSKYATAVALEGALTERGLEAGTLPRHAERKAKRTFQQQSPLGSLLNTNTEVRLGVEEAERLASQSVAPTEAAKVLAATTAVLRKCARSFRYKVSQEHAAPQHIGRIARALRSLRPVAAAYNNMEVAGQGYPGAVLVDGHPHKLAIRGREELTLEDLFRDTAMPAPPHAGAPQLVRRGIIPQAVRSAATFALRHVDRLPLGTTYEVLQMLQAFQDDYDLGSAESVEKMERSEDRSFSGVGAAMLAPSAIPKRPHAFGYAELIQRVAARLTSQYQDVPFSQLANMMHAINKLGVAVPELYATVAADAKYMKAATRAAHSMDQVLRLGRALVDHPLVRSQAAGDASARQQAMGQVTDTLAVRAVELNCAQEIAALELAAEAKVQDTKLLAAALVRLRLRMHELSDKDLARTAVAACRLCVIQPPGPMSGVLMDHSRPRHQAAHASYVPLAAVDERLLLGGKHNTRAGRAATQEDAAAVGVHPSELKVGQAFWARMAAEARRRVDMKMRPNLMAACSWALAQSSLFTAPMLDDATAALESPEQEEALQALATKTDRQDEGLGRRKRRRAATLQFQQQHAYASRPAFEETATALSMMYQAHVLRHAMSWGSWSGSCYLAAEARAQPPIAAAMGVDAMYAARCAFVEREAQHAKRRSRVVREVGQVLTELGIGTVASGHHCPASGIALDFAIKDWDEQRLLEWGLVVPAHALQPRWSPVLPAAFRGGEGAEVVGEATQWGGAGAGVALLVNDSRQFCGGSAQVPLAETQARFAMATIASWTPLSIAWWQWPERRAEQEELMVNLLKHAAKRQREARGRLVGAIGRARPSASK